MQSIGFSKHSLCQFLEHTKVQKIGHYYTDSCLSYALIWDISFANIKANTQIEMNAGLLYNAKKITIIANKFQCTVV